jgi:hypothetical protein
LDNDAKTDWIARWLPFCPFILGLPGFPESSLEAAMGLEAHKVSGVKVLNIAEENGEAIEKMVNRAIAEINEQKIQILEIQTTGDNLILILGEKKA